MSAMAEKLVLPIENLMTPDIIRRVLWTPPADAELLHQTLSDFGAREWQIELVLPVLETAIWGLTQVESNEQ
jgi:ribonuclease D